MYSNSSPSRRRYQSNDNMTLSYDNPATEFPTLDRPPSYETSMRESTTVNDHYGADRRSVRSVRSVRSKASNKSKTKNERREELPWVQITPSANSIDQPFRHYPQQQRPIQILFNIGIAFCFLMQQILYQLNSIMCL